MRKLQTPRKSLKKSLKASLTFPDLLCFMHATNSILVCLLTQTKKYFSEFNASSRGPREVSTELSKRVWLELVCAVSASLESWCTTHRIEIKVAMPQVIQADAVKDIEWLNRWLNCFLDDEALEVFEAQLLDAKKIEKTISLATRLLIHKTQCLDA